jgi:hypothetical protein
MPFLASSYSNPVTIPLLESGYQCYCLNSNDTVLYLLQNSGFLLSIDISTLTVVAQISTSYAGVN